MQKLRIVYMGTPEFAVGPLVSICEAGHEVVGCFTQPDKAKGRSKKLLPPPVKEKAVELGIPVYQPEKIRTEDNISILRELNPDMIVVVAFGQILPEAILNLPKYGCVNIHASLLPKYRGSAPIEWMIINGEEEAGVTTMYMDKGIDTGDMLLKSSMKLDGTETGESLRNSLSKLGSDLIIPTINGILDGTIVPEKQDEGMSSYVSMLTKEMGDLDFNKSAVELERLVRGLNPWPSTYTKIDGKNVKITGARVDAESGVPGTIIGITKKSFKIACGEGSLLITELQPEGKKPMPAAAYLNGNKLCEGMKVGNEEC